MSSRNESKYLLPKADKIMLVLMIIGIVVIIFPCNQEISNCILGYGQKIGFPLPLIIRLIVLVLFVILSLKFILRSYKKLEKHNSN